MPARALQLESLEDRVVPAAIYDQPITFTIENSTGLDDKVPFYLGMTGKQYQSPPAGSPNRPPAQHGYFDLQGKFTKFTNESQLPFYQVNWTTTKSAEGATHKTIAVTVPNFYDKVDGVETINRYESVRFVIAIGSSPKFTVIGNNGGVIFPSFSDPNSEAFKQPFEYFEWTERDTDGVLFINHSGVDQVSFPLTFAVTPDDLPSYPVAGVDINRQDLYLQFQKFIDKIAEANAAATVFKKLGDPAFVKEQTFDDVSYPTRIIAPHHFLIAFGTQEFKDYFNPDVTALFAREELILKVPVGYSDKDLQDAGFTPPTGGEYTFKGEADTVTINDGFGDKVYRVLRFTGQPGSGSMEGQTLDVFDPTGFTITTGITGNVTNGQNTITSVSSVAGLAPGMFVRGPGINEGSGGTRIQSIMGTTITLTKNAAGTATEGVFTFSDAPAFLPNPFASVGEMVFSNNGVFADDVPRFGTADAPPTLNKLKSKAIANIENQLVSSLNRGVSNLAPTEWIKPENFYKTNTRANFYAAYLHDPSVSTQGKAYGFPFDDQADQSSTKTSTNPKSVLVTLGPWTKPSVAVGADAGVAALLKVYGPNGSINAELVAYEDFSGGVTVALADVNGDGVKDIITGAAVNGHVKVFDGTRHTLLHSFFAYPGYAGGIFVAAGDIDDDGFVDIITGTFANVASHVKVFDGVDGALLKSFFAFDAGFLGGVRVSSGDINGDGQDDIIVSAGPGGGPHVKVFDGNSLTLLQSFFAFDGGLASGVFVAAGDFNGDGKADIIVGRGAGMIEDQPQVRVFSGVDLSNLAGFFAYDAAFFGGVRVGITDANGDNKADIVTGTNDGNPHVRIFDAVGLSQLESFFAYDSSFLGGVAVS